MATITPTTLRTQQQASSPYLSIFQPATLLTALVNNGSIARGARAIAYDSGTGSGFATIAGYQMLEVDTADGLKWVRLKSITGSQSSGTITVDENGIDWADNQTIRVKHFYPLVPVPPAIRNQIFYKFYDTAYSNQNSQPNPVAIIGSHLAGRLSGGSVVFNLNSSSSYAIASGATISSRAWSCVRNGGGTTGISFSSATNANPTLTITIAGSYWLTCTITDSNGKTQTTHRAIFVYDDTTTPYKDFTVTNLSGDWQTGGWNVGIQVTGAVDLAEFPDRTLVVLWYDNTFNNVTGYIDLWGAASQNIICCGYLRRDVDNDDFGEGTGRVSFDITTPDGVIAQMSLLGTISLNAVANPRKWYQYASWLTAGRGIHHLFKWHSSVLETCDILGLTSNTLGVKNIDFSEDSILQMANSLAYSRGIFAKIVSSRLGRLYLVADSQMLNDSERAALDTVFTLNEADISGSVDVVRSPEEVVSVADLDGFSFDGSASTPFISIMPGYRESSISYGMPEFRGTGTVSVKGQILENQTDSNRKLGRVFANENRNPRELRFTTPANYLGAFDIVPSIGWYVWGLADDDLKRDTALNGVKFVCRSINHTFDHAGGVIQTSVVFEPEAQGPDGIQGNYPTSYPTKKLPNPKWPNGCAGGWILSPPATITAPIDKLALTSNGESYSIAAWQDTDDSDRGKIAAFAMNSTPIMGTDVETFESSAFGLNGGIHLSPNPDDVTESLLVWQRGSGNQFRAAIVTRTDLEIAVGTATPFGNAGNFQVGGQGVMLSDTLGFAKARDVTTSRAIGFAMDISGSTITMGSAANIGGATIVQATTISRLDSTRLLVCLEDNLNECYFGVITVSPGGTWSLGTTSGVSPLVGDGVMHRLNTNLTLYAENSTYLLIATSGTTVSSVTVVARTNTTNKPSGLMIFEPSLFMETYSITTNVIVRANQSTATAITEQASGYVNADPLNTFLPLAIANSDVIATLGLIDAADAGQIYRLRLNC